MEMNVLNLQLLNRMFNAKGLHEFEAARAMCFIMCGLEDMKNAGAEAFSHLIHPSVMILKEGESISTLRGQGRFAKPVR